MWKDSCGFKRSSSSCFVHNYPSSLDGIRIFPTNLYYYIMISWITSLPANPCDGESRYQAAFLHLNAQLGRFRRGYGMIKPIEKRAVKLKLIPQTVLRIDFGHPVKRDRVYIVLVREELMVHAARSDFASFCNEICDLLKHDPDVAWCLCLNLEPLQWYVLDNGNQLSWIGFIWIYLNHTYPHPWSSS